MEKSPLILWYPVPARHWVEALPVGNGRLGAMVFGGAFNERIQLNEDTLWSGGPREWNEPSAPGTLAEVRRLVLEGKFTQADAACQRMQGPYTQSYLPLGNLNLALSGLPHSAKPDFYYRELDLDQAICTTHFELGGVRYSREVFASYPDQVIVIHYKSNRPGQLTFSARLDGLLEYNLRAGSRCMLYLSGRCPIQVDPDYLGETEQPIIYDEDPMGEGMRFEIQLVARTIGGLVSCDGNHLFIERASEATLLISAATSFNGYDKKPGSQGADPGLKAGVILQEALKLSTGELRARHLADYQRLFQRVELNLGDSPHPESQLPTDERISRFKLNQDVGLATLLFQFGRYLMIASSRPGSQPANLQGIWNHEIRPPWSSNWTLNINTEMNYWLAETCNLAECHEPLFNLIAELAENGRKTARINYDLDGWTAHHNTDLWRQSAPVGNKSGNPVWANWPMGGAWLCQHLWEHYCFSGDKVFLSDVAYPLMKGAAEFCLGWLIEDELGRLSTIPSVSPEQRFITSAGKSAAVCVSSTMDMAIIWDLFSNCIDAAAVLGGDVEFSRQLDSARQRLIPYQVGSHGQLQEWSLDFPEEEIHHRHLSHLFGLHPGHQIDPDKTPDLASAIRRSLELRGDAGTGWSLGWKINLWARLYDCERAYRLIQLVFNLVDLQRNSSWQMGGLYPNLFGAHPPFQIDGNFAFTAGVAEMLVQSHLGVIHLLPALPTAWPEGHVAGLRARGGFEIDITWHDGLLSQARIISRQGGICRVRTGRKIQVMEVEQVASSTEEGSGIIAFETQRGKSYQLLAKR